MTNPLAIAFKNEHLSVSRLKLYEQCALAFYFRYVDKGFKDARGTAADFGTVLHAALELLYLWVVEQLYEGLFPTDKLIEFYKQAWEASGLTGVALFQEGLGILRTYAASAGLVDHMSILAVECEFNIELDGFTVNGFIDRVDRVGEDHIVIVDYKSNRMLFTRDELETDLQMSIYGLVARRLFPWAKRISFSFHMLRHDTRQNTERTAEVVDDAAGYVVAIGRLTERPRASQADWPPTLNANCSYCEHRSRCPLYQRVLEGKHEVTKVANTADFGEVAAKREELHKLAKILYAKKKELDDLIHAKLKAEGEFDAGGYHYRYISGGSTKTYDPALTIKTFAEVGVPAERVAARVLRVDNDAVEAFRVEVVSSLERSKAILLNMTLAACATVEPNTPKLDSRAIRTAKKVHEDDVKKEAEHVAKETKKRDRKTA